MALDLMVAQTIFKARQIERAANDPGPWTVVYGSQSVPAVRWIGSNQVIFRAHFPDACWMQVPESSLTLRCRGDIVGVRAIDAPDDGEFTVEWQFALAEPIPA